MSTDHIPKEIQERPIKLPGNKYWVALRRFGRDEMIAFVTNVIGTLAVAWFTQNPIFIAIAGPVFEKIGFFPAHIREAYLVYKTTPQERRRSFSHYLKNGLSNGTKSLIEDLLLHDPLYILFMFIGFGLYASSPAWMISAVSFMIAVVLVSVIEVSYTELRYWLFKQGLKRAGFLSEQYYESRFLISKKIKPGFVINKLAETFDLKVTGHWRYHDTYYHNLLPHYSQRIPKVRLRLRTHKETKKQIKTAQIVYRTISEINGRYTEQYRYFPIKNEKFYHWIEYTMPDEIQKIQADSIKKRMMHSCEYKIPYVVDFERIVAHDEELMVSADTLAGSQDYFIVEVKVYKDKRKLMEAMRFVMREFPVVQTTSPKSDLAAFRE